jgi:hypothetical protein
MDDSRAPRWLQRVRETTLEERHALPLAGVDGNGVENSWSRPLAVGDEGLGDEAWQDDIHHAAPIMEDRKPRFGQGAHGDDRYPQEEQEAYDALAAAEVLASFGTIAGFQDEQAAQVRRRQRKESSVALGGKKSREVLLGPHLDR